MTLFGIFRETILSPADVIQKAIQEKVVPPYDSPEYIKGNFSQLVEELQLNAYNIYLEAEKSTGQLAIKKLLLERTTENADRNEVITAVSDIFNDLDRFFLSLTQSRRVRAGSAFEIVLKTLFKSLDYPFDEQQVINGKPDFLMPSRQHYDRNPMDCIIFTAKRTLRERWRQIVTEGTRGLGFYLATIDEGISAPQLGEMLNHRIYIVVPDNIKNKIASYKAAPNVITFEDFFRQHLDPAVRRWKENGIIG
jgi:hypothetical protein